MTFHIKSIRVTIGSKNYRLVPSASCRGCAFENRCYREHGPRFECPVFNDYAIASDLDLIYKEIKRK